MDDAIENLNQKLVAELLEINKDLTKLNLKNLGKPSLIGELLEKYLPNYIFKHWDKLSMLVHTTKDFSIPTVTSILPLAENFTVVNCRSDITKWDEVVHLVKSLAKVEAR